MLDAPTSPRAFPLFTLFGFANLVLAPRFRQHTRYVDSYGWTDYDNAVMRGDCREVIAKGKPLRRSD